MPVGFWKVGIMYISLGLNAFICSSTEAGIAPYSSVAMGRMSARYMRMVCRTPRKVGSSSSITSPGLMSALHSRSMPCCEPVTGSMDSTGVVMPQPFTNSATDSR